MQEIAKDIFIEWNSIGLLTALIRAGDTSVLIDAVPQQEEVHSNRGDVERNLLGTPRFLIVLDSNYDRLMGARACDLPIIAHTNCLGMVKPKQVGSKGGEDQNVHSDGHDAIGNMTRLVTAEIIAQDECTMYLGETELRLEHHSGSNSSALWAILPMQKVVFVGDAVPVRQAPFLAYANLTQWLEDLELLQSDAFADYQIVSSRSGPLDPGDLQKAATMLQGFKKVLARLEKSADCLEDYFDAIPELMQLVAEPGYDEELCQNRLHWGLTAYYELHYRTN